GGQDGDAFVSVHVSNRPGVSAMWVFAWQNLFTRPSRTALAVVGLTIPVLAFLGLFSLSQGIRDLVGGRSPPCWRSRTAGSARGGARHGSPPGSRDTETLLITYGTGSGHWRPPRVARYNCPRHDPRHSPHDPRPPRSG